MSENLNNVETISIAVEESPETIRSSSPDLLILINRQESRSSADEFYYQYNFHWADRRIERYESPNINRNFFDAWQGKLKSINALMEEVSYGSERAKSNLINSMRNHGADLYETLFRNDFDEVYWTRIRNKVKSIKIVSEDSIPWEIIRPRLRTGKRVVDRKFWCELFDISHWFLGEPPKDEISIKFLDIVHAILDNDFSGTEKSSIEQMLEGSSISCRYIRPDSQDVSDALISSNRSQSILHLICHGAYNSADADQSYIRIGDGYLRPDTIAEFEGDREDFIVFLNGCETGIVGKGLNGAGGWPYKLISHLKTDLVIGTTMKVPSEAASKFAIAFYNCLLSQENRTTGILEGSTDTSVSYRCSVLEATRKAREAIKSEPAFLSYKVYGNPMVHITYTSDEIY